MHACSSSTGILVSSGILGPKQPPGVFAGVEAYHESLICTFFFPQKNCCISKEEACHEQKMFPRPHGKIHHLLCVLGQREPWYKCLWGKSPSSPEVKES